MLTKVMTRKEFLRYTSAFFGLFILSRLPSVATEKSKRTRPCSTAINPMRCEITDSCNGQGGLAHLCAQAVLCCFAVAGVCPSIMVPVITGGGNHNEGALSGSTIALVSPAQILPLTDPESLSLLLVTPVPQTGSITFKDGLTTIGSSATIGHGSGKLTISSLAAGSHRLPQCGGNSIYATSTSSNSDTGCDTGNICKRAGLFEQSAVTDRA